MRDHLAAFHRLAALDQDIAGMGVGGDEAVGGAHQHQVAVALELAAGIGDDAVFGRFDRRALGHRQVDAVVLQAVRCRPEAGDSAVARFGPAAGAWARGAMAEPGCTSGMMMRSPTFTMVSGGILLALASII